MDSYDIVYDIRNWEAFTNYTKTPWFIAEIEGGSTKRVNPSDYYHSHTDINIRSCGIEKVRECYKLKTEMKK